MKKISKGMKSHILEVIRGHLRKYVDTRAHIAKGGELRYSVRLRGKWVKKQLPFDQALVLFEDLYGEVRENG